jgi:hypothetical protein
MCWKCDHPEATFADWIDGIRAQVDARGHIVMCVEDVRRPFAYTIGLHRRGQPELLVTGLPPKHARWLINTFAKRFANRNPTAGEHYALPARTRLEIVDVDHPDAHMNMALAVEGRDVTAIQLVWADDRGRWPWAPGFDDGRRIQPVLGRRASQSGDPKA